MSAVLSGTAIGKSGSDHRDQCNGCYQGHTICGDPDTSVHGHPTRRAVAAVVEAFYNPVAVVAACQSPAEARVVDLADSNPAVVVAEVAVADNPAEVAVGGRNLADHSIQNCRRRNERPEQWMRHQRKQPPQSAWRLRLDWANCPQPSAQSQPRPCEIMA